MSYFTRQRARSLARVIESAKVLEAPLAVGSRVRVLPVHVPGVTTRPDWQGALPRAGDAPVTDGREGLGEIVGLDFDVASVRLDSGEVVKGIRRYRIRREEA